MSRQNTRLEAEFLHFIWLDELKHSKLDYFEDCSIWLMNINLSKIYKQFCNDVKSLKTQFNLKKSRPELSILPMNG